MEQTIRPKPQLLPFVPRSEIKITDVEVGQEGFGAKEAVALAKAYVSELYEGEAIDTPELEEVWYESKLKTWLVALGIRHRATIGSPAQKLGILPAADHKIVRVSAVERRALSMRDRLREDLTK